ncbi:MAG: mechanosensitive ion channel family protein [Bacillota bacterium]
MTVELAALTGYWAATAKIAAVLVLASVVVRLGDSLIARLLQTASKGRTLHVSDSRSKTLAGLLRSALRYTMGTVFLLTALDLVGIDTRALLGGAAIFGVAIGFGAQNLVRDIITGFFIIYERQYDVGDYVSAAGVSGTVEEIGLRTTRLRDWSGDVHVIPNGLIDKTTNRSRSGSRALVDVTLAHEVDARKAIAVMQAACDEIAREHLVITDGPVVLGISSLEPAGVVIQVWARTKPLEHFAIEREIRLRIKEALQSAGIEMAHQLVTVIPHG